MPFIISNLERLKAVYLKKNENKVNQTFQVSPKIQLNLLLNFESYDINTQYQDSFMPEEKTIKFNISEIKLRTRGGKMRITQERVNGQPKKLNKNIVPYGAYSIIEEGGMYYFLFLDVFLEFDKPVTIQYLYIRLNENSSKERDIVKLVGYLNGKEQFSIENYALKSKWTKISFANILLNSLKLQNNILFDDISIMYDSSKDDNYVETENNLSNMLSEVIDELMEGNKLVELGNDDV